MLALAPSNDVEMYTFFVTNHGTYPAPPPRLHVTLAADATLHELHTKVAEECQFVPGTFEIWAKRDDVWATHRLADDGADQTTLMQAALHNRCKLQLHGIDGNMPLPCRGDNSTMAAAALGTVALWSSTRGEQYTYYGPLNRGATSVHGYSSDEPNADGFVGLVNQGATCYLSSLLQSLYMTPEFRQALYSAGTSQGGPTDAASDGVGDGGNGTSDSAAATDGGADGGILWQLQRLFVTLQTSKARAVDTRQLTRSFGWDASDSFTQHDVQELLRVLFDALEDELKHTSQAGALERIYRGEWTDYVQCKTCGHLSSTPSSFDDINLAIRAFDEQQTPFTSLDECLTAFLSPETLEGDNAYYCEACGSLQPALKGEARVLSTKRQALSAQATRRAQ